MPSKHYRTFVVGKQLDSHIQQKAQAAGVSVSKYISEALSAYEELDQDSVKRINTLAGVLGIRPARVINNLVKARLQELEERRRANDPAAVLLGEIVELGS